jgi:hypothetical protein
MSTVNCVAQERYASVVVQWPQNLAGKTGGDGHSDTGGMLRTPSQPHAPTPPIVDGTGSNSANDNQYWEGGFAGHLGVYRRD